MVPKFNTTREAADGCLCPQCGGRHVNIQTWVRIDYEVILDGQENDLEVVSEMIGDAVWDANSPVRCPVCQWTGRVSDLRVAHTSV